MSRVKRFIVFRLFFNTECGHAVMSGTEWIIRSTGYDQNQYANNLDCRWSIDAEPDEVRINVLRLRFETKQEI